MFKIKWSEPFSEYPYMDDCGTEKKCVIDVKVYLAKNVPEATIMIENRGVYVIEIEDAKKYFSSASLKPLWRIGESFSKILIAEIIEVDYEEENR